MIEYAHHGRLLVGTFVKTQPEANKETFQRLLSAIPEDLMPVTLIEPVDGQDVQRLAVGGATQDYATILTFSRGRLDYTRLGVTVDGQISNCVFDIHEFLSTAAKTLVATVSEFELKAHRLSFVQEGFLNLGDPPDDEQLRSRILPRHPTELANPFEWDWRMASRVTRKFASFEEETNTIATVKRGTGTMGQQPFDRVRLDIDINTAPTATEDRFDGEGIQAFLEASETWHSRFLADVLAFLNGDEVAD